MATTADEPAGPRATAALLFNGLVWGLSWWPFRQLEALGVHPLWTTVFVFASAGTLIALARPRAIAQVLRTPLLWGLMLAAGTTNAAFNWAVTVGDVVRVVLLFYLMPLWAVLLGRVMLDEPLTWRAAARVVLALAGAATVLWPQGDAPGPLSRGGFGLSDALGLLGGFTFALNNVLLRRAANRPEEGRALAMFVGGVVVAGGLIGLSMLGLTSTRPIPELPPMSTGWLLWLVPLACCFLLSNLALQYGAARLSTQTTAMLMLSEVLFATVSSSLLGGAALTPAIAVGAVLILAAAALRPLPASPATA